MYIKHGKRNTRLYRIWLQMKNRCYNENTERYSDYGGRGISVCDEWKNNFQTFYDWSMSNGYDEHLTIDRIDNDGNYSPENCRWSTVQEQVRNTRSNVLLTLNGETHCVAEWSEITGIKETTIRSRIRYGWNTERILTNPARKHKEYENRRDT